MSFIVTEALLNWKTIGGRNLWRKEGLNQISGTLFYFFWKTHNVKSVGGYNYPEALTFASLAPRRILCERKTVNVTKQTPNGLLSFHNSMCISVFIEPLTRKPTFYSCPFPLS